MDNTTKGIIAILALVVIGLYIYISWCFMKRFLYSDDEFEIHINRPFCIIWTFSIGLPITAIVYFVCAIAWLIDKIARLGR